VLFQDASFSELIPGSIGESLDAYFAKRGWKLLTRPLGADGAAGYQVFFGEGVQVDNRYEYGFPYLYDKEELLSFARGFYARNADDPDMAPDKEMRKRRYDAVLTQRSCEDGFTKRAIIELLNRLELTDGEEVDPICLNADSVVIFGFIRMTVSDEKLGFMTDEQSEFGRQAVAVANDLRQEEPDGLYCFAGVNTLMYYQ